MKNVSMILIVFIILLACAGCVSKTQNTVIRVTDLEVGDITPVPDGSFDVYTTDFRVENPTNMTFQNVEVTVNLLPLSLYCHPQSTTIDIPVLNPVEKRIERWSFSELSDLDCQYNSSYTITTENQGTSFF
jgi:hypothetical protein